MHLRALELHGSKAFAERQRFEFGPGITVVVGPNGSGKSNVADAIRWALGEQSTRQIRARRTEDVIFSGSEKRRAMGSAEVTLTLDNAEGWMPIDFGEVAVTRRAERSGENAYRINGQRVRLGDVLDLFRRAQVGQNSYAMMTQGLVDEVLALRPRERRALIEEAGELQLVRECLDDEAAHRLQAAVEQHRAYHRLVGALQVALALTAAGGVLPAPQAQRRPQPQLARDAGERGPADELRAPLREQPLLYVGMICVELLRDHEAERRVAEELQPLVRLGRLVGVLVHVGGVRERRGEQRTVAERRAEACFEVDERRVGGRLDALADRVLVGDAARNAGLRVGRRRGLRGEHAPHPLAARTRTIRSARTARRPQQAPLRAAEGTRAPGTRSPRS